MRTLDTELDRINIRSEQIYDRLNEIQGEKTTIQFQMDGGKIDFVLGGLKLQTLDYEAMLLIEETFDLESDLAFVELADELNLEIQPN